MYNDISPCDYRLLCDRLPERLVLTWPEGDEVADGDVLLAGQAVGDMRVEIHNRKGEPIKVMPGSVGGAAKLMVQLQVRRHLLTVESYFSLLLYPCDFIPCKTRILDCNVLQANVAHVPAYL